MRTRSIPAPCTWFASSSVISWFTSTMTVPSKSLILSRETRPTMRSRSGSTSTPASIMGSTKFRTARAGVRHDVDGVDVALFVLILEGLEHFVGHALGNVAPNGDDLVVALAIGDGAIEVLLLHLDNFLFGVLHQLVLIAGNEHV